MNIKKILVPVVFLDASLRVVHQAAYLARHFQSEIILLHVVTPMGYPAGVLEGGHEITARDLDAEIVRRAKEDLEHSLRFEFDGIAVRRLLLRGHPASEIAQTALDENVDLIVMSTHGYGPFHRLLLGSVTAKVLHEAKCPVWTGAHLEEAPSGDFAIRNILCAVDFNHGHHTLLQAAQWAGAFGAHLTLAHVTSGVEAYGPGGFHVVPEWKETLVGYASSEIAKLQQDVGTKAAVIIESGNVPKLLNQVAENIKADVLITGHTTLHGHLGDNGNGYSIIRDVHVPVLSV